jgi:hypothetical protein
MTLNENGGLVRRLSNSPLWLPSSAPFSETPNLYFQLPSHALVQHSQLPSPAIDRPNHQSIPHLHTQLPLQPPLATNIRPSPQLPIYTPRYPSQTIVRRNDSSLPHLHTPSHPSQTLTTPLFLVGQGSKPPERLFGSFQFQVSGRPTSSAVRFCF